MPLGRVLVGNNDDTAAFDRLTQAGTAPEEQVWALGHLRRAGFDARPVLYDWDAHSGAHRWEEPLRRVSRNRLGNVPYELELVRQARSADIVVHGHQDTIRSTALAKRLHLWNKPTISLCDPVYSYSRINDWGARSMERLVFISRKACEEALPRLRMPRRRVSLLPWGPDLRWDHYRVPQQHGFGVLSTGKTQRNHLPLLAAAKSVPTAITIYADVNSPLPQNVTVKPVKGTFTDVVEEMSQAAVIAIPIREGPVGPVGITELNAAMALGKPVVISRNDYIDVPIESLQCGFVIDAPDPKAWARAINHLISDPLAASEMGAAGRKYCEQSWNNDLFGDGVVGLVTEVLSEV